MTPTTWRAWTHTLLERTERPSVGHRLVTAVLVSVVVGSVATAVLETLARLASAAALFRAVEAAALAVLAAEYLLRLWSAPEGDPLGAARPWRARLQYVTSFAGVIDLVAILSAVLPLVIPIHEDWLRALRVLRLLKLARYAPALPLFVAVLKNERRPLLATLFVVVVLLVLESTIMYTLEREAQPQTFASIPDSMWWAIVTIATVGYGDVYPVTPAGKVFGSVAMILGIAVFAVPAGILATGFATEIRKRDFVVTWQSVARVPLFAGLDASRIAEIARLLKSQVVPAHYVVVRRGDPADAMFFIMAGEVLIEVEPAPIRLGKGQFFGEIALLRETVRTATITTLTECQLLTLDVEDFRRLLAAHPAVKAAITRIADERLAARPGGTAPPPESAPARPA
jgi:voltage-gated potassium channel